MSKKANKKDNGDELPPKIDDIDEFNSEEFANLKISQNKGDIDTDTDTFRHNLSPEGFRNKICGIDCDIEDLEFQIYELKKSIRKKKRKQRVLKDEKLSLMQCYLNLNNFSNSDDWGDTI